MAEELHPINETSTVNPAAYAIPRVQADGIGVGRLAEAIGVEKARKLFDERKSRREYLYLRALQRWEFTGGAAIDSLATRPYPRRRRIPTSDNR